MRLAADRCVVLKGLFCRLPAVVLLSVFALAAQAQNKCSATGVMGGEKFVANNCAVARLSGGEGIAVAIWFNENPILPPEAERFQISASASGTKDGKERTLLQITFCPGGGAATASATAVKWIELSTNHSKSPLAGIQLVVDSPKEFKVEKMTGDIKPGGTLAGKITGSRGKTTWNLEFDVKLPATDAAMGIGCSR